MTQVSSGSALPFADAHSSPTVLVVEPDALYREALVTALQDAGVPVLACSTGWGGLAAAAERPPLAVILSWGVLRPDAASVVWKLRTRHGHRVPILVLLSSEHDEGEACQAGASQCLRKGMRF